MSESDRSHRARQTGVGLAVIGTAASGLVAADAASGAVDAFQKVRSSDVVNNSLLLQDFKRGQLESRFYTKKAADKRYVKLSNLPSLVSGYIKATLAGYVKLQTLDAYVKTEDADKRFLKVDGIAANTVKLGGMEASQFVQGTASIMAAAASAAPTQGGVFLNVPGLVKVEAVAPGQAGGPFQLKITNLGDGSVRLAGHFNNAILIGLLSPGESKAFNFTFNFDSADKNHEMAEADGSVQLLLPAIQKITTISIGAAQPLANGDIHWSAQAVIGR